MNIRQQASALHKRRRGIDSEEGFTLIELLIVIVVLAILATIVIFAVGGITGQSVNSACSSTVKTINTAAETYYAQNGAGATDLSQLATYIHESVSGTSITGGSGNNKYTVTFAAGSSTSAGNASGTSSGGSC